MRPTTNLCNNLILWLFAAALLTPAGRAFATDFYLSPSGDDANSGVSAAPWRTLQKAANTVSAGDVVHVADGTYAGVYISKSGTAAAPITFRADGANALVNSKNATTDDNINVEGGSYVVIDGFVVEDSPRAGIRVVEAAGVVVKNNRIARSSHSGILTGWTPGIQIIDNISYGAVAQHGIYVANSRVSPDDVVIRGNECYGNGQNGIQLNGDCWEGGDGIISGAVIEDNFVHDNNWKGFSLISVQVSIIRNNVICDNGISAGAGGIHLVDQPDCNKPSNSNVVVNNTIIEPRIAGIRISLGSAANVIFNNVVVASSSDYTIADEVTGNWIDATSNILRTSSTGLFADAASKDFHLADASAAVGAGVGSYQSASAPTVDQDGNIRPQGGTFDSGAYEKNGTAPPTDTTPPTVAVTSPAINASVSGTMPMTATASDNIAVAGVQFVVDGTPRGSEDIQTPYQASVNTALLGNGTHSAAATARDAAGNTRTSAGVSFQVSNAPTSSGILAAHPRLAINPTRLAELRAAACYDDNGNVIPNCTPSPQWVKLRDYVALCYATPANCYIVQPYQFALAYMINGNINYANQAIAKVDAEIANGLDLERTNFYLHADDKVADCAFVFDWLYDLLSPQKRATYIDYMNRLVQEIYVEDEYNNPFYESDRWATNDPGNNYYYAQLLCALLDGLSTFGENDFTVPLNGVDVPMEMYFHKELRAYNDILQFVNDKIELESQARWIATRGAGGGWHEGVDYGTAAKNQIFAVYLYLQLAGGKDYFATTTFPRAAALFHIYAVQPGGDVRYNGGDSGRDKTVGVSPYERETAIQLARGLQGTVESQYLQNWARRVSPPMGSSGWQHMYPVDFMWTDVNYPESDFNQLPLSYLAGSTTSDAGLGWVNSRSSWADDAVSVSFICSDRVQNHQHKDQNSFVIYKGVDLAGWLAIDSNFCSESNGLTKNGAVHNILMVNGQDQRWGDFDRKPVKHEFTNEYSYVIGDAADAYWTNPGSYATGDEPYLQTYLRELVHAMPNYVIVYDRVTPLAKFTDVPITYLLNTQNEPTISGNTATAISGPNKLVQQTLLPSSGLLMTTANSYGCRRLEIQRSTPTPNTQFLNAIWVGPATGSMPPTDLVSSSTNNMVGAHIKETGRNFVVMFSSEPTGANPPSSVTFQLSTIERTTNVLFGLLPETEYQVDVTCADGRQLIVVERGRGQLTSPQGTLRFVAEYAPDVPVQAVIAK